MIAVAKRKQGGYVGTTFQQAMNNAIQFFVGV